MQMTNTRLPNAWRTNPDAVLPALFALPLLLWTLSWGLDPISLAVSMFISTAGLLALGWRRSRPVLAGGLALGSFWARQLLGYGIWGAGGLSLVPLGGLLGLLVLFSLARNSRTPRLWLGIAVATALLFAPVAGNFGTSTLLPDGQVVTMGRELWMTAIVLFGLLAVGVAWGLGYWARQRDQLGLPVLPGAHATTADELVRQWWQLSHYGKDGLLAAIVFGITLYWAASLQWFYYVSIPGAVAAFLSIGLALAYALPLVWRRSHPDAACLAVLPVHLLQLGLPSVLLGASVYGIFGGFPFGNIVVPMLLFSAAKYSKQANLWLGVGLAGAAAIGLRWASRYYWLENLGDPRALLSPVISVAVVTLGCALVVVSSWGLGRMRRYQRDTAGLALGRAQALASEQEKIRLLAAEQERSRIAREMHDIVAHSLSVIVVQADGAGYTLAQPGEQSRQLVVAASALEVIGSTARTALAETRRLVGVLRDDQADEGLTPMVSLAALPALLERTRAAGLPLEACFEGDPDAHGPLGAGVEAAAYRIVQEALTNVMKHAGPGAFATVLIEHTATGLHIAVRDDGQGPGVDDGHGHGLIGMHERVAAFGGSLVTQGREPNGFEVVATLPAEQRVGGPSAQTGRLVL